MGLSEKFIKKYMRMANHVADNNNACYSRKLGVVLVKVYPDGSSHDVGTGYNGPPRRTPHCDTKEYLEEDDVLNKCHVITCYMCIKE